MKLKSLLFITILSLIFYQTMFTTAIPIYSDPPEEERPLLQIVKWVSDDEIILGEEVTVYVNITNWGKKSAYNLTIREPIFSPWTANEIKDYELYTWVLVESGASISYEYTFKLLSNGNYSIEATSIDYFDENNFHYNARTNIIEIVVYEEDIPVDESNVWTDLFKYIILFISIPIIVFLVNQYVWRRN